MQILFLHGWQSVPGGVKPTFLAQQGHEVIEPKLPDEDFEEAVRMAQAEYDRHRPAVVVGSSRGGAVAMIHNISGRAGRGKAIGEAVRVLRPGRRLLIAGIRATRQHQTQVAKIGMFDVARRGLAWRF
jgi:hypothetical protein